MVTGGLPIGADTFVVVCMILGKNAPAVLVTENADAGDPADKVRKLFAAEFAGGVVTEALKLVDDSPNKAPDVEGTVVVTEPNMFEA